MPLTDGDDKQENEVLTTSLGADREEEVVALSNYDLSSINCCSRVCFAFEEIWNVL